MGMTMTQKILAAHAGLDSVEAGQLIEAKLDVVMANDLSLIHICIKAGSLRMYEGRSIWMNTTPLLAFG